MRWKLMRRRLSITAPRVIVRRHLPWPLRWAVVALVFGFSAAIAMWAFEFGKDIAGLDRDARAEIARLRTELSQVTAERDRLLSVANTADSLLKAEKVAQERLAQQVKRVESENLTLKSDLGFFERLLPARAGSALAIRSLHVERGEPGSTRLQMLVMQPGKSPREFRGRYEVTLVGTLDGKPWTYTPPEGTRPLQMKQYLRIEEMVGHPPEAVVESVQVRVLDTSGGVKATHAAEV
jgi:hypothetical protein